ncbi:MAG: NADH-quinone oxidoreductase subunit NuoB [Candidatus Micrarchaeaceae archaeon]
MSDEFNSGSNAEEIINAEQKMTNLMFKSNEIKPNVMFLKLKDLMKYTNSLKTWSRKNSVWPMLFGLACCAIELMDFGAERIDAERKGYLLFRGTPRQCDVMIVAGWVTKSIAPRIKRLYEQMLSPKYVIAYGECAVCGGPWFESYNIIKGVDQIVPVDIYVAGCPPKPENLFEALIKLQKKINGDEIGNSERSISSNIRKI